MDRALQARIFLLLTNDFSEDPAHQASRSREAVLRVLRHISPYLQKVIDAKQLRSTALHLIGSQHFAESGYVQQLLLLFSLATEAQAELDDVGTVDYLWSQLFFEEHVVCLILLAGGQEIARPSERQLRAIVQAIRTLTPWDSDHIDIKDLFSH